MYTILLAIALTAAPQVDVQTLDGRAVVGSLVELNSRQLTVETPEGRVSLTTGELLQVVFKSSSVALDQPPPVSPRQTVWVELLDGSSLIGMEFAVDGKTARVKLRDGSTFEVPTAVLATVRLKEQSEQVAQEWSRIVGMRHTTDVLIVGSGETIDYHKGVLRDVSPSTVQFELDGDLLPVKRLKVHGLLYYHPPDDSPPEPICEITDVGGSRWSVQTLELGDELTWTTPGGLKRTQPLPMVRQIDFSRGKIVFLSDLNPESLTYTPYFGTGKGLPLLAKFFALREDKNLQSGPLQLGKKKYSKGLALHSRTKVVYRLPGRFSRLQATVGIDDGVRPRGNVRLVIYGDDRVLLETTVTGADPPKPIDLDLNGVRRIAILADFGKEMDVADHLDLCEARILK